MTDDLKKLKELMESLTGLDFEKQYQESKEALDELPDYIEIEYDDGTKDIHMTEEQRYAPGTILQDSHNNSYWLVLAPNEFYPIKFNSVANLLSGSVVHIDWLVGPKEISHLEIMW